jgi:hypothetical protein
MSEKTVALVPAHESLVDFYDDQIPAAVLEDDLGEHTVCVAVRAVCDFIGVDWSAQYRRIQRDPVLSAEIRTIAITATDGKVREQHCLPASFLHGFLFGINASRVKTESREALILYQRECYAALSRHFQPARQERDSILLDIEATMRASAELARVQREQGDGIDQAHVRLDAARGFVLDLARRIAEIEVRVGFGQTLTQEQASDIKARVNEVAGLVSRIPGMGGRRNPYGSIYGSLYREFGVTSYKHLRITQYAEAVRWLDEHADMIHGALEAGQVPTGLLEDLGIDGADDKQ